MRLRRTSFCVEQIKHLRRLCILALESMTCRQEEPECRAKSMRFHPAVSEGRRVGAQEERNGPSSQMMSPIGGTQDLNESMTIISC
jgi:hypothetical protein